MSSGTLTALLIIAALLLAGCSDSAATDRSKPAAWPTGHAVHSGCVREADGDVECPDGHELDFADAKKAKPKTAKPAAPKPARKGAPRRRR